MPLVKVSGFDREDDWWLNTEEISTIKPVRASIGLHGAGWQVTMRDGHVHMTHDSPESIQAKAANNA